MAASGWSGVFGLGAGGPHYVNSIMGPGASFQSLQ